MFVTVGIIFGIISFVGVTQTSARFDPNAVGLGLHTVVKDSVVEGHRYSGRGEDIAQLASTAKVETNRGRSVHLWLGASQTHAINEIQDGDRLAVEHANGIASSGVSSIRHILLSEPNANWHEIWSLLHEFLLQGVQVSGVTLAFTYDDLREPAVRPALLPYYAKDPIDNSLLDDSRERDGTSADDENAENTTPQLRLETFLLDRLADIFPAYAHRDRARAHVSTLFRNGFASTVFRFLSRPQEKIPQDRQAWNMSAFNRILDELSNREIPVIVYKAPHQPGLKPFYHPRKEYDEFFSMLEPTLNGRSMTSYLDLEQLVPADSWGMTNAGQPDVFHFSNAGHALLGQAIHTAWQRPTKGGGDDALQ